MCRLDGAAHELRHALEKQSAICESGQHIVVGQIIETLLAGDVINGERDVAGQFRQQFHLILVKEFNLI